MPKGSAKANLIRCPECNGIMNRLNEDGDDIYCSARIMNCRTEGCVHSARGLDADGHKIGGFPAGHPDGTCSNCGLPTCSECGKNRQCERFHLDHYSVCQMHGGGSPKARGTGGGNQTGVGPKRKYDKWLRDHSDLGDAYEALQADGTLDGYEEEGNLIDILITDGLQTLRENGPLLETWKEAKDTLAAFDRSIAQSNGEMADYYLSHLRRLLDRGAASSDVRREIRDLVRTKAQLVGKERDFRLKKGYAITVEGQLALMEQTMSLVLRFVAVGQREKMIQAVRALVDKNKKAGLLPDEDEVDLDIEVIEGELARESAE